MPINDITLNNDIGSDISVVTPDGGGWGTNTMQIPTNKPIDDPVIKFDHGFINFKQVQIPSGFVYHKISVPISDRPNDNNYIVNNIIHKSIKLDSINSFIIYNSLIDTDPIIGDIIFNPTTKGIGYKLYHNFVFCVYKSKEFKDNNRDDILIYLQVDLKNFSDEDNKISKLFFNDSIKIGSNIYEYKYYDTYDTDIYDVLNFLCGLLNNTTASISEYKLFNIPLYTSENDNCILSHKNINFLGAKIKHFKKVNDKWEKESDDTIFNSSQKSNFTDNYLTSKYSDEFYKYEDTTYKLRGIFNTISINNNIVLNNDLWNCFIPDNSDSDSSEPTSDYSKSTLNMIEAIVETITDYKSTFIDKCSDINEHNICQLDLDDNQTLISKLSTLTDAENDILWGKGIKFNINDYLISSNTFKKNKILLKIKNGK